MLLKMYSNSFIFYFGLIILVMQDIHLLRHNLLSFFENNIYNSPNNWAVEGNLRNIRIEEIPFSLSDFKKQEERPLLKVSKTSDEIYANRNLRKSRSFFHIFKVPCKLNINMKNLFKLIKLNF